MRDDPIDNPGTEEVAKGGDPKGNSKKRSQQLIRPEHAVQRSKPISRVVTVRRPATERYFRTHPSDDYWFPLYLVEVPNKNQSDTHLVLPDLYDEVSDFVLICTAIVFVDRHHNVGLWEYRGQEGTDNAWHLSALEIAHEAREKWVHIINDGDRYASEPGEDQSLEPQFPDIEPIDLAKRAFAGKVIDNPDHSAIATLKGR